MNKNSRRIAEIGMLAAISIVVMMLGVIIEPLDLTMAFMAGLAVMAVRLRWGRGSGWLLYFGVSVLSFLLLPNRLIAALYFLYGGLFPMVKADVDLHLGRVLGMVAKILFGCAAYTAIVFVSLNILGIKSQDFSYSLPMYAAVAVVSVCLDVTVSILIKQFGTVLFKGGK